MTPFSLPLLCGEGRRSYMDFTRGVELGICADRNHRGRASEFFALTPPRFFEKRGGDLSYRSECVVVHGTSSLQFEVCNEEIFLCANSCAENRKGVAKC